MHKTTVSMTVRNVTLEEGPPLPELLQLPGQHFIHSSRTTPPSQRVLTSPLKPQQSAAGKPLCRFCIFLFGMLSFHFSVIATSQLLAERNPKLPNNERHKRYKSKNKT